MSLISNKVNELARQYMGNVRLRDNELMVEYCPFCHGGENGDTYTFSVGLYNGAYNCLRGSCGAKGSFKDLCNHFGVMYDETEVTPIALTTSQKKYKKPDLTQFEPVTDKIISYFATRAISEETVNAFHIAADPHGNIIFPFYRDGEIIYGKLRKPEVYDKATSNGPKEWCFKDCQPILFGMDMVSLNKPLFITEGEIDAMSLYEAGITNVVSVPQGCKNMEWIPACWEWLEKFQQIVLFGDQDEPGIAMVNTLMKRLGEDRCMIAPQYPSRVLNDDGSGRPCKDANEILTSYDKETLRQVADNCKPAPVEGILNLASVPYVDPTSIPRIFTRIPDLDNAIGGLGEGGLTVISGKRGEGKSTISGEFLLNAIEQGKSVAAYSGELSAYKFLEWIMCQANERKYMDTAYDRAKQYAMVPYQVQERIKEWISDKFFLFDNTCVDEGAIIDSLIRRFTICARRYGCSLFLVDNLMCLCSGVEDENRMQAKITSALKQFAVKYKAHVILVAHPRKTPAGQAFNSEDVAGSAAITNLADNVLCIEKPNIRVTKNREFGETPYIVCDFDPATRRIFQHNTGDTTIYSWNHEGLKLPEHPASEIRSFDIRSGAHDEDTF